MSSKTVASEAVAPFPASKQDGLARISPNGLEVLRRRYLRKGVDGKALETVPEMFWRVASHVALPERAYGDEAAYQALAERFYDLLTELRFFPNSPTFTGAGTPLGQLAACQPYHARVVTARGLIPIGELAQAHVREAVVAFTPPEVDEPVSAYRTAAAHEAAPTFGRIQAAVENGVKPVLRLTVFGGLHLDVTPDHRVWASPPSKHGQFGWYEAGDLEPGWQLMVDARPKPFATEQVDGFDDSTAAVVGWLQADGYVGQPPTATSPIIEFETINDDEFTWIQDHISRSPLAQAHQHVREQVVQNDALSYRRIRIYGQEPFGHLQPYGLTQRKQKARVPEVVFRSPAPVVASYLRALFQSDGSVERSGFISLASVSRDLLEGVQLLLLQAGICSQIIGYRRAHGGRLPSYKLHIGLYSSRLRFEEWIGFVSAEKRARLAALNAKGGKQQSLLRAVEIDRIMSLGDMPVYDIQTDCQTYFSAHIAVHNCFVLAIDDDMGKDSPEGIFNTLRNAALIQQTGGGNGFSFSRLRPKSDPVNSSAGVASGPVGFLRVYDAAFGEIAQGGCLLPETLVHTSQGTLRLDELVDSTQPGWQTHRLHVATDEGDRPSPRGYNNGVQPVMAVATSAGLTLTGTVNHKVKVMSAAGPTWRRLDELQPGDAILVMLGQHQGRLRALRRPTQANGLPALLDETLAFVLGYTAGKGQISAESFDGRLRWEVAHDSYLIEALPRLLQGLFPGASIVRHRGKQSSVLVLDSVPIKRFWQANGLLSGVENADAGAPRLVRQSTAEVVGAYLRGLFEALGSVAADGYPQLEMASPRLAQEIATLLIGLGAPVQVTPHRSGATVCIRHHCGLAVWRERIGCDPASRFAACHTYHDPAEAGADYALPYPEYWLEPVLARLVQAADGPALPEIGSGLLMRRKLQPYLRGETPLTSRAYREFCATSPQFAEHAPSANDLWFVTVQSTQLAGEALTLDLEVEGNHTYLANGLVTHNTRRGANMGVLRVDHPDIEEFIACKAEEGTIANFNISVGVTDAFMQAVETDGDFALVNPHTQKVSRTVRARDLFDKIIAYAHRNGEPGVLFLDAANRSNPVPHLYELEATNPCVTGDTLVATPQGWRRADSIQAGDDVCTVLGTGRVQTVEVNENMPIYELHLSDGGIVRATASHQFHARNSQTKFFEPRRLDQLAMGDWVRVYRGALPNNPVPGHPAHLTAREYGFLVGVLVGDGCYTPNRLAKNVVRISTHADDHQWNALMEEAFAHVGVEKMTTYINPGSRSMMMDPKPGRVIADWVKSLPLEPASSVEKSLPDAYINSNRDFLVGLLDGLFSTDGSVDLQSNHPLLRFHTASFQLAQQVRRILLMFGVHGRIHTSMRKRHDINGRFIRHDRPKHDVVISGASFGRFFEQIRLSHVTKQQRMQEAALRSNFTGGNWAAQVKSVVPAGVATVYDLYEPVSDTWITEGYVSRGCGEQYLGPFENCCLGSINLAQHVTSDGRMDWEALRQSTVESTRFLDDVVSANKYVPAVPQLQEAAHRVRRIGLGVMGLADVMYKIGVRYGDRESLDLAGQVMEFVRFHCMKTSIELARERGPFPAITGSIYDPAHLLWQPPAPLEPFSHDFGRPAVDWGEVVAGIQAHGIRNGAQTTIAPTGCLTAGSLVVTDQGVLPIETLGDINGERWQAIDLEVASEQGPSWATQFYLNGRAHTWRAVTRRGYAIQGTDQHRIRVWENGVWRWQRMDELRAGMTVPLKASGLVGDPQPVPLNCTQETDFHPTPVTLPATMSPELAYLVGFFMGDGSCKARSLRFAVSDPASEAKLSGLIKQLFNAEAKISTDARSATLRSVELHSVNVVAFWRNNGFAKELPHAQHRGKGYRPLIPLAVLRSNDPAVYGAFLAGLFDADGAAHHAHISWLTTDQSFHDQVKTLLLALGVLTTSDHHTTGLGQRPGYRLRTAHADAAKRLLALLPHLCRLHPEPEAVRRPTLGDVIPLVEPTYLALLAPATPGHEEQRVWRWRQNQFQASRASLTGFVEQHRSELDSSAFDTVVQAVEENVFYDEIVAVEDGGWQETYDLSVPGPHAYLANGFVSHNTIGTVTGCEGYGCEPVFALAYTRYVKEAGGDVALTYVSPLFLEALDRAGITGERRERIVEQIVVTGTCQGLDELPAELQHTFVVSQDITPTEHVWMQAALQRYVDNSISKTVNFPEGATPKDVETAYLLGWELGCKGLTVYVTGSRQEVVLETKATADAKKAAAEPASPVAPEFEAPAPAVIPTNGHSPAPFSAMDYDLKRPRPRRLHGATYRRLTPLGTAYVTVNDTEEGEPFEIFMNVGKAGSDVAAVSEALGRLISLVLRMPSSLSPTERLQQVVYQLNGIGGGRHLGFGPQRVRSLPDAIAQVLSEHLEQALAPQPIASAVPAEQLALPIPKQIGDLCPDCGNSTLLNIEGCVKCHVCGYSEC